MKIRVDKKRWNFALVNVVLLLLTLVCAIAFGIVSGKLQTIDSAERWRGDSDMRFAQIGCFLPVDSPKAEEDIWMFRRTLDQKLLDHSLSASGGKRLYTDAYSGQAKLTVSGDHGKSEVNAIGVGGEFFLFHPLRLLSGSYISEHDLMQDRVILDETLAWRLFGSSDVAGMTIYAGETPLYVAGVIQHENDYASREAYGDLPAMFVSYSAFHALTEAGIICYEIVMPDMISGFAATIVEENFDVGSGDIVEISSRYSISNLVQVIKDFGVRSMRHNGVIYPYSENAVRMTEDHLALLLVLMVLFASVPVITAGVIAIRAAVGLISAASRAIPQRVSDARERKREEQYARIGEK